MMKANKHDGERWPYHEDPHGNLVPCENNPCRLHGGSDIIATSLEDAYRKLVEADIQMNNKKTAAIEGLSRTINKSFNANGQSKVALHSNKNKISNLLDEDNENVDSDNMMYTILCSPLIDADGLQHMDAMLIMADSMGFNIEDNNATLIGENVNRNGAILTGRADSGNPTDMMRNVQALANSYADNNKFIVYDDSGEGDDRILYVKSTGDEAMQFLSRNNIDMPYCYTRDSGLIVPISYNDYKQRNAAALLMKRYNSYYVRTNIMTIGVHDD